VRINTFENQIHIVFWEQVYSHRKPKKEYLDILKKRKLNPSEEALAHNNFNVPTTEIFKKNDFAVSFSEIWLRRRWCPNIQAFLK